MILEKDFTDFVVLLNKHQVDYMVIGGYALAFHGEPRMTGDMDIWIDRTTSNTRKLVKVVNEFGMASLGLTQQDFMEKGIITQIGYPPLRIDILNEIDGVEYKNAVRNKQFFTTGRLKVPFIGRQDFINNKIAAGRKKDLRDAQKLTLKKKIKKGKGL